MPLTLSYETSSKKADVTVKVSTSGYSDMCIADEAAIIADFAPVVTYKKGSKSYKRVLSLSTTLWFDRSNVHS